MSSSDISEAMAYERLEPWGDYRADVRSAIIASTIANAHRSSKSKAYSVDDFMPKFGKNEQEKTLDDEIREVFGIGPNPSIISD
jgi:hypothetical protein